MQFISALLTSSTRAYAAYAAQYLLERNPHVSRHYAGDPFGGWRSHFEGRIEELATALELDDAGLFGSRLSWARAAFEARGVPVQDLTLSVDALEHVLQSELPGKPAGELRPFFEMARGALVGSSPVVESALGGQTACDVLAMRFMNAVLSGERSRAVRLVLDAVPERVSLRDAYTKVLIPAEVELGRLWHMNELGVGEEHFATATVHLVVGALSARIERGPELGKTVLTTAAEGNLHTLGAHVLADFFEMDGWRVIHLNGPLPTADLIDAVAAFRVDVVALSAMLTPHLRLVKETVRELRGDARSAGVKVLVGGHAFNESEAVWEKVGADGYAADLDGAVRVARSLVGVGQGEVGGRAEVHGHGGAAHQHGQGSPNGSSNGAHHGRHEMAHVMARKLPAQERRDRENGRGG